MDRFLQVLIFTLVVAVIAPKDIVGSYLFFAYMGLGVSVASVIPYDDAAGLGLVRTQFLLSSVPLLLYLLRCSRETGDRPHLVFQVVRFFSPVSGIDPGTADQPQPPAQDPVQDPGGQQEHGHGQAPDGYTVIPEPERVDGAAAQGESIEEMVDEIDDHRE